MSDDLEEKTRWRCAMQFWQVTSLFLNRALGTRQGEKEKIIGK
jgi:hypothetical protein